MKKNVSKQNKNIYVSVRNLCSSHPRPCHKYNFNCCFNRKRKFNESTDIALVTLCHHLQLSLIERLTKKKID